MKTLNLVCQPSWMRDELAAAGVPVIHSYGLDVPDYDPNGVWWMPQGYAVELNRSLEHYGLPIIPLIAPGPELLTLVPERYLLREIVNLTVSQALDSAVDGWWKSAEAKIENFPSEWRTAQKLTQDISYANLPDDAILQVSTNPLDIVREYRTYVVDGSPLTTSIYLDHTDGQVTVYDGAQGVDQEMSKVEYLVASLAREVELPPSVVVDTAVLTSDEIAVLEFNPTWCSAWYNNDIAKVMKAIEAAFDLDSVTYSRWKYRPDSYLVNKVNARRILPRRVA